MCATHVYNTVRLMKSTVNGTGRRAGFCLAHGMQRFLSVSFEPALCFPSDPCLGVSRGHEEPEGRSPALQERSLPPGSSGPGESALDSLYCTVVLNH